MSIAVMNRVWGSDAITDQGDLCILLALADWSDDEGRCWPSLTQLARKSRSHRATVIRRLAAMRGHWIEWDENDGGRSRRNQYRLNLDNILTPLPDDRKQSHDATVSEEPKQSHGATVSGTETVARCDQKQSHGATRNKPSYKPPVLTTAIPNRGGGIEDAGAREEQPPPPADVWPVPYVSDDLQWLPENDQVYAPTITELLATYRPTAGDQLLIHTWRQHSRVPFSSITALLRDYPWPVFVAGVVIAADDRRPNLKFLQSILRRLNDAYNRPATDAGQYGRPVAIRDGIHVYDITARPGGALPPGVSAGRNGGARQTSRRNPDFKRPSERSWDEHLRAGGIDPAELAPGATDYDLPFGPHRSAGGPGDGQTLPLRPLLRVRA